MKSCWNYYELLHVQPDAPTEIIRSSYRTLMLKLGLHPDIGGDDCRAALINQAYETLIHPEKRAEYDRLMLGADKMAHTCRFPGRAKRTGGRFEMYGRNRGASASPMHCCIFCKAPYHGTIPETVERRCACCQSPLNPVENAMGFNDAQRRAVRRMVKDHQITFYTAWPQHGFPGHIRDLSPMGMQMDARKPLQPSQIIKIESGVLEATAEVVHSRTTSEGGRERCIAGVRFRTLWFQRPIGTFLSITA